MARRHGVRLVAALFVMALVSSSCAQIGLGPRAEFELRMGSINSFTGDLAAYGPPIDEGAQIAVELINESLQRLGEAERIQVVWVASEDDQTNAAAGVEAATKLVEVDRVDVIIGALGSTITAPIAESVTVPNGVLLISPASTGVAITALDDDDYVWRTAPSDALQGRVIAQLVAEAFGADATINTGTRNDAYGVGLVAVFEEAWREGGGTIGQSIRWDPNAATFDSEAAALVQGDPDGWVIIDFPATWDRFGPALVRTGGWDPTRTFTADGLAVASLPESAGRPATEGMRGTVPSSEGTPAGEAFDRLAQERGMTRGPYDAYSFDAVIAAFLAAVRAGTSDPGEVRGHLRAVTSPPGTQYTFEQLDDAIRALLDGQDIDYQGASGPIAWDEAGDPSGASYGIWIFRNGEIVTEQVLPFGG